jgi:hypothetical protein
VSVIAWDSASAGSDPGFAFGSRRGVARGENLCELADLRIDFGGRVRAQGGGGISTDAPLAQRSFITPKFAERRWL